MLFHAFSSAADSGFEPAELIMSVIGVSTCLSVWTFGTIFHMASSTVFL